MFFSFFSNFAFLDKNSVKKIFRQPKLPKILGKRQLPLPLAATMPVVRQVAALFSAEVWDLWSLLISPPGSDSLPSGLMFYCRCLFIFIYFNREISEMRRPIGAKFYTLISTKPNFIMPVQNFGGPPPKNLGAKTCKICIFSPSPFSFFSLFPLPFLSPFLFLFPFFRLSFCVEAPYLHNGAR